MTRSPSLNSGDALPPETSELAARRLADDITIVELEREIAWRQSRAA